MAVMQAAPSLGHSSSPPAKQMAAPHYNKRKPLFSAPRKRSVGRHSQMTFPGEDAPGTGRRHFPEELPETRVSTAARPESFGMRSTQDMYRDFPAAVRSSFPLYVRTAGPQEPLGLLERRAEDAGPDTRARRRPAPVDTNPPTTRLHHAETPEALKKEVASRKGC